MILKEQTFREFNIDVDLLLPNSTRLVYFKCENCEAVSLKQYRSCKDSTLCLDCFRKKQGEYLGNKFGKSQLKQGLCKNCGNSVASNLTYCKDEVCAKVSQQNKVIKFTGPNNPAWSGRNVCACGKAKSTGAKKCRVCSFADGDRSGANNGRFIAENREEYLTRLKVSKKMRGMLSNLKRSLGIKKYTSTEKMLGYTFEDFRLRIESTFTNNMNWSNMGEAWHIDHIVPVDWFIKNNILDPKKINALYNLRAFNAQSNLQKNNKITDEALILIRNHYTQKDDI